MSVPARYTITRNRNGLGFSDGLERADDGHYVRYDDYAALQAEVERLKKDFYEADKSDMSARDLLNDMDAKVEELQAENERLRARVATMESMASDTQPDGCVFRFHERVTKTKGSSWTGRVVGFYTTKLTPIGYCVESENEPGSVQLYPEASLHSKGGKDG